MLLLGICTNSTCISQTIIIDSILNVNISDYNIDFRYYQEHKKKNVNNFDPVLFSFFGDYEHIYDNILSYNFNLKNENEKLTELEVKLNEIKNLETHNRLSNFLTVSWSILNKIKNVDYDNLRNAKEFIIKESTNYNFTLINEAHYNGQHRVFSKSLLQGLWDNGYRYLAIEGLGYNDQNINKRNYPIFDSGYYIKESNYGNFLREANNIGFIIIPYETKKNIDGTKRDFEQAINIYNKTVKINPNAKVIVHAGYDHINEVGDEKYLPLGFHLKKILKQDILTIDQHTMSQKAFYENNSNLYLYIINKFEIYEPIVPLDNNFEPIIDIVHNKSIDIQVYHPLNDFINNRPKWMIEDKRIIELPSLFDNYKNCLLEIRNKNEPLNSIPIDIFILNNKKNSIIVDNGSYFMNIINENGDLIAVCYFKVSGD